jgi:hypothetical protein
MRGHAISERLQVATERLRGDPASRESRQIILVAMQPLATSHQLQATEEQIETVGAGGTIRLRVRIERPLDHWIADHEQELGAMGQPTVLVRGQQKRRKDGSTATGTRHIARVTLDGKRLKATSPTSRAEAIRKINEAIAQTARGATAADGRLRAQKIFDDWLAAKRTAGRKPRTLKRNRELVDIHLGPGLGHLTLRQLQETRPFSASSTSARPGATSAVGGCPPGRSR